jgi:hypothetical protein
LGEALKNSKLAEASDDIKDLSNALSHTVKESENVGNTKTKLNLFSKSIKDNKKQTDLFRKTLNDVTKKDFATFAVVGSVALNGFKEGVMSSMNILHSFGSFALSTINVVGHLAASIITFPFKALNALIHAADAGGSSELQQALENIRKEFGYLNQTAGGAIIQMGRSMRGELANTGLSVYRIFGNLAKRLEYFMEYAKAVGPAFDTMMHRIGFGGAEALGAYNKALGLSNEAQRGIAERAMALGQTVNQVNHEIANYALQLSRTYGLTMKTVSREMGEAIRDVQHFGHLSVREIGQATVYARRLGIEVKNLGQVMDKYLNFEDAAEGASRLSQAFGMNIDAMQLMQAQDPAQKLELIRRAFFQAGRTVEQMTVQERRYLAQQTGLDDAAVNLAFSLRGQAMSYDQIQRAGNNASRTQMTQAQVLQRLAGAIERIVQSGGGDGTGFFDRFFRGFLQGIRWSREFRGILINLRRDLHMTRWAGVQMGREFVRAYPPIQNFFNGIREMFNPATFRRMLNGVKTAFREFFTDLSGPNKGAALTAFANRLKETFLDFFSSRSPAGQRFLAGARQMLLDFTQIINWFARKAIEGLTTAIEFIGDLLTGKRNLSSIISQVRNGGGFLGQLLGNITDGLGEPLQRLWNALKNGLKTGWDKYIKPFILDHGVRFMTGTLALAFARAAIGATVSGIFISAARQGTDGILNRISSMVTTRTPETLNARNVAEQTRATNGIAEQLRATENVNNAVSNSRINSSSITKTIVIGAFIIGGIYLLMDRIKDLMLFIQTNHITPQTIAITAGAMFSMTIVIGAATFAARVAGNINPANMSKAIGGMAAISAFAAIYAFGSYGILRLFQGTNFTARDVGIAIGAISAMSTLLLATTGIMMGGALIGAIASIGGGVGALAMLAGVAGIVLIARGLVPLAMELMSKINEFRPQPGFIEKARAFSSIVQAIGTFASIFVNILSGTPGFLTSLLTTTNPSEEIRKNIGAIKDLIQTVTLKTQEVFANILQATSNLTQEQINKARAFGDILTSIGSLFQALKPPDNLTNVSFFQNLAGETASRNISIFETYISNMMSSLQSFARRMTEFVRTLATVNIDQNNHAIRAFVDITAALGHFATALIPSPQIINAVAQAARTTNSGGWMAGIRDFVNNTLYSLVNSNLISAIGNMINSLLAQTSNLNPTQLRNIQTITPLFTAVFNTLTAIMQATTSITNIPLQNTNDATAVGALERAMSERNRMINTIFSQLSTFGPTIVNSLRNVSLSSAEARNINVLSGVLTNVFNSLSSIINTIVNTGSGQNQAQIGQKIHEMFIVYAGLMGKIADPRNDFNIKLNQLATYRVPDGISSNLTRIKNVFTNFNQAMPPLLESNDVISRLNAMPLQLRDETARTVGEVIREVVGIINSTSQELSRITPNIPNINVALRSLADNLHLQGTNAITIQRRDLTLNIPVNVIIEARELQTVLVNASNNTPPNQPRIATTNSTGRTR